MPSMNHRAGQLQPDSSSTIEQAQAVILAIVSAAGGTWNGRVRLCKAYWWSHVLHARKTGALISEHPISRLPMGPAPTSAPMLLRGLEAAGLLSVTPGDKVQKIAERLEIADADGARSIIARTLTPRAQETIREAVRDLDGKTGTQASDWSHDESVEWQRLPNGSVIDVFTDAVGSVLDDPSPEELADHGLMHELFGESR